MPQPGAPYSSTVAFCSLEMPCRVPQYPTWIHHQADMFFVSFVRDSCIFSPTPNPPQKHS